MSEEFKIEIVNPEKSFLSKEDVTEVVVPAFEGEMGILKDHISIISFLKPGIIKIFLNQERIITMLRMELLSLKIIIYQFLQVLFLISKILIKQKLVNYLLKQKKIQKIVTLQIKTNI